jgi:hypothetical protein
VIIVAATHVSGIEQCRTAAVQLAYKRITDAGKFGLERTGGGGEIRGKRLARDVGIIRGVQRNGAA